MKKIKVILVDDHAVFRTTFKVLLGTIAETEVIAEASNGQEFLDLIDDHEPDIVFMDIKMPKVNGIEATEQVLKKHPNLRIIALTMFGDEEYFKKMIAVGAVGFLLKNAEKEELEIAVQIVMSGDFYYSKELTDKIYSKENKPREK